MRKRVRHGGRESDMRKRVRNEEESQPWRKRVRGACVLPSPVCQQQWSLRKYKDELDTSFTTLID